VLDQPVAAVMTVDVVTCAPSDSTEQLMGLVTERRIRHVPVVENDRLTGLVSIGDIVAARVHELEDEAQLLHDYISAR
jgi:CBS domain-containing protein